MNPKEQSNIQNISCCSLAVFAGLGVYFGIANALGVSRMPALLIGLAITVLMLLLYRFLISKGASGQPARYLALLPLPGVMIIISINYCGIINLWKEMAIVDTPFFYYALIAAALLVLAGLSGDKGLLRACPIICISIIIIALFDTVLILSKAEPSLVFQGVAKPAGQIVQGGAEISVALLAPGVLLLLFLFIQKSQKSDMITGKGLLMGLIFPVVYLIIELIRDLLLFGDLIALDKYPIIRTLKTVYFGVGVSRLEFLGITVLSLGALTAIMLEFIVLSKLTENVFNLNKKYLIPIEVVLILVLSTVFYHFGQNIWVIAEAGAILLLFAYPLILILKK